MTLQEMKEKVEGAKVEKAKREGQIESINKRLKDDFNLDSVEDAEKYVEREEKSTALKETELQEGKAKLEADYNWD